MCALPTGTVTFLFTDIEGSTQLWELYPTAMQQALARHDTAVEASIERHGGTLVRPRGEGDSRFAVFARATDAVAAACALQRVLLAEPWPTPAAIRVRIALHTGEADLREDDYYGSTVNRCARLRGIAHGGQTLLSLATTELVRDGLPEGVSLRPLGAYRLRDLQRPEQVFQLLHPDLPADYPPLNSLDAYLHNLPVQLTSFIGRAREIAEVKRLLSTARNLTLMGAGGSGKTRLALQVAAELLEVFADGIWFVELAAIADPALVPQTVAEALAVREEPGHPLTETLVADLRPKSLLLLLDNCEHLISACAQLVDVLLRRCPKLRILATSRQALGLFGELAWSVPPMALPAPRQQPDVETLTQSEAARLFIERAVAALPTFRVTNQNASAVAQICQRLDGIPLAIELAAARIKLLPPGALLGRLESRLRLLTGGARNLPLRQQTMRNTIAWSYELLDESERRLFRRLSVFVSGTALPAAEAVCSAPGDLGVDILEGLASLVDKSLLRVPEQLESEPRFMMLETIREYGLECLTASGEAEIIRRAHVEYYLRLAKEAEPNFFGPELEVWLDRMEAEHDNIRAALEWSETDHASLPLGLELAGWLWRFWEVRGHSTEGRRWLDALLAKADTLPGSARAFPLHTAGNLARAQGDNSRAKALYEECLALSRELGYKRYVAHMNNNLGSIAIAQGDYNRAEALYEKAIADYKELGATWNIATALLNLGSIARNRGDYDRARSLYEESLALFRQERDKQRIALGLENLGELARWRGDFDMATALSGEALMLYRGVGDKQGMARVLQILGKVAQSQHNHGRATTLYKESLMLSREVGDKLGIAKCLEGLAGVAYAEQRPERAGRLYGAAEAQRKMIGVPLLPIDRSDHECMVASVRAALGAEAFAAAWNEGRAMTPEQAIEHALALDARNRNGSYGLKH